MSRSKIRRVSTKKAKADRIYNARVKVFLKEPLNRVCRCCMERTDRGDKPFNLSTNVHHKHGRGWRGELLMIEALWIPCCTDCHPTWIDSHRDEARKLGLLAPKGQWNHPPKL